MSGWLNILVEYLRKGGKMKGRFRSLLQPMFLLLVGIVVVITGCTMEMVAGGYLWLVVIAGGSCLIASSIAFNVGRAYWK